VGSNPTLSANLFAKQNDWRDLTLRRTRQGGSARKYSNATFWFADYVLKGFCLMVNSILSQTDRLPERCPSWPKGHDWKSCVPNGTEGSNPSLSAIIFVNKNDGEISPKAEKAFGGSAYFIESKKHGEISLKTNRLLVDPPTVSIDS
jgi:hypothetical protein